MKKIDRMKESLDQKYETNINRINLNPLNRQRRIVQITNKGKNSLSKDDYSNENSNCNGNSNINIDTLTTFAIKKNIEEKLDKIFDIYEKIESSIENNFQILEKFLNYTDLNIDNPIQDFVDQSGKDILSSFIFSKLNYQSINLNELLINEKFPKDLKNFIFQDTKEKFYSIRIDKSDNYELERRIINGNESNLDFNEFIKIFSSLNANIINSKIKFKNLKELMIVDCVLENLVVLFNLFCHSEIIKIKSTIIKMQFTNLARHFSKLKILSIKRSNLNNLNLNSLIRDATASNSLEFLQNLEILDLSHNKISQFDLIEFLNIGKKFYSLKILNLTNNKFYKFKPHNLIFFPFIKLINLSANNFTIGKDFYEIIERIKSNDLSVFVPINRNIFIINNRNENKKYIEYLIESMKGFEYLIETLDFSFVFNNFNKTSIYEVLMNSSIQTSLLKLNLSNCSLGSNILITFIKNNNGLINLKNLDLSSNNLDDFFLETYNKEHFYNILDNLDKLIIS